MLSAVHGPLSRLQGVELNSSPRPRQHSLNALAFAPNPGMLGGETFVPSKPAFGSPLVVVLHGCNQTPQGYDRSTAWTALAERHGFAVLFPKQPRANNPNGCFNWFEPGDMVRGEGEPASIKSMIDRMIGEHGIDPSRVYITGLSAGAAMAGVMLATYPEVFASGGLIAGLPYGVARSMPAALNLMRGGSQARPSAAHLGALVRDASGHRGRWPVVSIWHGTADTIVNSINAEATVAQWLDVHGLASTNPVENSSTGYSHRIWKDALGRDAVEQYVIDGMGHGTPLDARNPANGEKAGAFMLDVGLSSTLHLATSWGLIGTTAAPEATAEPVSGALALSEPDVSARPSKPNAKPGIQESIENALRAAGLMR